MTSQDGPEGHLFGQLQDHMLVGQLDVLLEATSEIAYPEVSARYGGLPADGSQMAVDLMEQTPDAIANVQRVCGVWNMVAAEYLQAIASVHQDGHLAWAPGPLLRAALEHSARIGWVLDGVDARSRAARSWLAEVIATGEDARTHHNVGDPVPTLEHAPERLRVLCEVTLPGLFGEGPDTAAKQPNQWTLCGERWGDYTTTVQGFFTNHVQPRTNVSIDGRVQYRVASMFAHPSTSAAFSLAAQSEPGQATFAWHWNLTRLRTSVVLLGFYSATSALYEYLGWQSPGLTAWMTHLQAFVHRTEPADPG